MALKDKLAVKIYASLLHNFINQSTFTSSILFLRVASQRSVYVTQSSPIKSYSTKSQASQRHLSRKDYNVGWVCALPIELAAAHEMLDEEHQSLPLDADDTNLYTLGRIAEHNVVIACLPAGQMGTNSAAAVAVQMKLKFNAIRFGLMVGIGGGVPSAEADIRLGDVVVSQPHQGHGGVVQYDIGKATPSGFVRTEFLNTPPTILLNSLSKLRANYNRNRGELPIHLSKLSHLPKFARNNVGPDVLFEATYKHTGGTTCESCSGDRVVERQPRESGEIVVHYGTIASGNQVMRDGATRDSVSSELGSILCFEMEAAGLMNNFPCLVIRGICDYADSHKNKKWQAFAAGTAAAYAKEVLSVIPPAEVVMTPTADETGDGKNVSRQACWSVPFQRNPRFVGRISEIAGIDSKISTEYRCERVAIVGLGGSGKTQIALEFTYQFRERWPDCSVFWVPAMDDESIQKAYLEIGRLLGIPNLEEQQAEIKKLVQHRLSQESAGRWLLVFDNADDIDMWINEAGDATDPHRLIDYLPKSTHGSIMFTTRSRKTAVKLAGKNVILVEEMDESVAKQLLSNSLIDPGLLKDERSTVELLKLLTFLPLAIVQAAAYINENEISLSEYLALLQDTEQGVIEVLSKGFEDEGRYHNVKNPVASTWLISFEQIRRRDALAAEYLSFMACVDPKDIPLSLLPPAQSSNKFVDAIGTLSAYSFVTKRPASQSLDLHGLVHLATRNWLRTEESLEQWTRKAIAWLEKIFPDDDNKNRSLWRAYLPHARYILGSGLAEGGATKTGLLWKFGLCLYSDGRYGEAERSFLRVMEARKRVLGQEHPDMLTSMNNLALMYHNQGQWDEAKELQVQVMETRKRILGHEHPDTLTSMNNLGSTYRNQGRWKEAEELQVQVMETRKKLLRLEHPDTLTSMANLALIHYNQGRWKEAEELEVQVMETRKRLLGQEHPDTLTSMSNLASTYWNQGRWKEAEELEVQVMETSKRLLGQEHPDTLISMSNLASTYWSQERLNEAEELQVQALEMRKRVLGQEHPDTLTSMSNLASTYRDQGRWKEAEELEVQVIDTRKKVLGQEHPDTLTIMNNLAWTWKLQGRDSEALKLISKCVKLLTEKLGANHPTTKSCTETFNSWMQK